MEIKCPACDSGYRIPIEKLPPDKEAIAFPCPNCSHPLSVQLKEGAAPQEEINQPLPKPPSAENGIDGSTAVDALEASDHTETEGPSVSYDASEKPVEFLDEVEQTALICDSSSDNRELILQAIEAGGFHYSEADSTLAALKQMRYHQFDLVVLNENFDAEDPEKNPVRIYLSRLPMATRRHIFVVLINRRFRTMDNMAAFNLSVNQVVHEKNLDQLEKIITSGLIEHKAFYKSYQQAEETAGEVNDVMLDRSF